MATKYKFINELYNDTLQDICSSKEIWKSFLNTASMKYKYSYTDQVLIYAQKPEAKACASIETRNNSLKRWVNKGAKGIALLTEKNGYSGLTYVFDVSDTNSRYGKNIELWSLDKKYEEDVIESLGNKFGDLVSTEDIYNTVLSVTSNIIEDNIDEYIEDIREVFNNEIKSFEESQESRVSGITDDRSVGETLKNDSRTSNNEIRQDDRKFNYEQQYNRGNETNRSNEVDSRDEQYQESSRRNGNSRTNINLCLFPTEEEQKEIVEAKENASTFFVSKEDIDKCLLRGSSVVEGKYRIYQNLTTNLSTKDSIEFMKQEYGWGGGTLNMEKNLSHQHDAKGITITKYGSDEFYFMNWTTVIKEIKELINNDRWFNSKEVYQNWLLNKEIPINNINEDIIEFINTDDEEIKLLYNVLNKHKINDIKLEKNNNDIIATDSDNTWCNNELYDFIFDEVIVDNNLISNEDFQTLKEYRNKYPKTIKENKYTNEELIGQEVTIENGNFEIESINENEVELRDIGYHMEVGYPIFTTTSLENVLNNLRDDDFEIYSIKDNKKDNVILPTISDSSRLNYKITNNDIGVDIPKERYKNNINAIKVLKECESTNRLATKEEQIILSNYVGLGWFIRSI